MRNLKYLEVIGVKIKGISPNSIHTAICCVQRPFLYELHLPHIKLSHKSLKTLLEMAPVLDDITLNKENKKHLEVSFNFNFSFHDEKSSIVVLFAVVRKLG